MPNPSLSQPPRLILVTRMHLSDATRLLAGGTFQSFDRCRSDVEQFCTMVDMPCPSPFTSISVFLDAFSAGARAEEYGEVIAFLRDTVIMDIVCVCNDDVMNVCLHGLEAWRATCSIENHRNQFARVEGSVEQRRQALARAAQSVEGHRYAEARLGRVLQKEDVECFKVQR